jgi:hypothetical protein
MLEPVDVEQVIAGCRLEEQQLVLTAVAELGSLTDD